MNFDKLLVAVSIIILTIMVMFMHGRIERFDEKISWCEEQMLKEVSDGKG